MKTPKILALAIELAIALAVVDSFYTACPFCLPLLFISQKSEEYKCRSGKQAALVQFDFIVEECVRMCVSGSPSEFAVGVLFFIFLLMDRPHNQSCGKLPKHISGKKKQREGRTAASVFLMIWGETPWGKSAHTVEPTDVKTVSFIRGLKWTRVPVENVKLPLRRLLQGRKRTNMFTSVYLPHNEVKGKTCNDDILFFYHVPKYFFPLLYHICYTVTFFWHWRLLP